VVGSIAGVEMRVAGFGELSAEALYRVLRLRVDVFVVEQECAYPELDGRDVEAGTRHVWVEDGDEVVGYLRVLEEPGGVARVGRVCVAAKARGAGYARRLMTTALELVGERPAVLDAQAHLAGFYAGFGFRQTGPGFVEDGIPHVPMRRG
jgi:ElaA protein